MKDFRSVESKCVSGGSNAKSRLQRGVDLSIDFEPSAGGGNILSHRIDVNGSQTEGCAFQNISRCSQDSLSI
jgi:hypothetical protein